MSGGGGQQVRQTMPAIHGQHQRAAPTRAGLQVPISSERNSFPQRGSTDPESHSIACARPSQHRRDRGSRWSCPRWWCSSDGRGRSQRRYGARFARGCATAEPHNHQGRDQLARSGANGPAKWTRFRPINQSSKGQTLEPWGRTVSPLSRVHALTYNHKLG